MNIENKKQFVTLLLAVALGLVAAILTSGYVKSSITAGINQQAKQYRQVNTALDQELKATQQQLSKLSKNQELLAKKLRERPTIVATQQTAGPATTSQTTLDSTAFSVVTPPGKRALTVNIDSLAAVGGLVNPGDYVDVIAHLKMPDGPDPEKKPVDVTTVLFQDIQVLAVGTNFKPVDNALTYVAQQKSKSLKVTLALTPEEAALLAFSESNGKLQLSLRSPTEQGKQDLQIASWDTLADYVKEHQGTDLSVPRKSKKSKLSGDDVDFEFEEEEKPFIQIFRKGREL